MMKNGLRLNYCCLFLVRLFSLFKRITVNYDTVYDHYLHLFHILCYEAGLIGFTPTVCVN